MPEVSDSLHEFLLDQGGYELCAALLQDDRSRQELIALVDASEATIDRQLNRNDVHAIQRVPTTDSELVFTLDNSALHPADRKLCDVLRTVHTESGSETVSEPISRDNINRSLSDPDSAASYEHANARAGYSKFINR